jgi:hypothetical protein
MGSRSSSPAKAGAQAALPRRLLFQDWAPAFAGVRAD